MHALTDQPLSVALGGSIAYFGIDNGILAYDLSDPEIPIHVGTFALSGVERIFTSGDEMFISNGVGGSSVSIVDSSDPSSMSALSTVTHPVGARARDIVRGGDLLFIGVDTGNVYVYDISELGSPVLLNTLNYSDPVYGIALNGVRLFAATSGGGAFITDISDIMNPSVIGSLGTDDSTGVRV